MVAVGLGDAGYAGLEPVVGACGAFALARRTLGGPGQRRVAVGVAFPPASADRPTAVQRAPAADRAVVLLAVPVALAGVRVNALDGRAGDRRPARVRHGGGWPAGLGVLALGGAAVSWPVVAAPYHPPVGGGGRGGPIHWRRRAGRAVLPGGTAVAEYGQPPSNGVVPGR